MKQIFTFAFGILCLSLSINPLHAQCPAGGETFTGFPLGNNADFFASAEPTNGVTAGSVTSFGVQTNPNTTDYQLQLGVSTTAPTTYKLTSPTYNLTNQSGTVFFRFDFGSGGAARFDSVMVGIRYITTNAQGAQTLAETTPIKYTSGTCASVTLPSGHLTSGYQIIIYFYGTQGNGSLSSYVFIDNFATAGVVAQAPLPVHFSSFTVKKTTAGAQLTWKVEAEENVSVYEVQSSTDGRSFTKLSTVEAKGLNTYGALDNRVAQGPTFYRIKSVDIDGRFLYSTVVVLAGDKSSVQMKAFMSDRNTLTVQHDAAESGSRVMVSSMDGRVIKSQVLTVGSQQTTIDLSAAQGGIYIVRYDNGTGGTQSIKFIKQ
jgi:hypothetical protein